MSPIASRRHRRVWLGATVGCARCHDHKYDPITQKEFYQFFAFFNNTPDRGFVYNFGNEPPFIHAPLPEQAGEAGGGRSQDRTARDETGSARARRSRVAHAVVESAAGVERRRRPGYRDRGQDAHFDYRDPFTFAARIRPETRRGAILSIGEDYFEGKGHFLYLMDGKLRLHITFRFSDLGMRVETADPLPHRKDAARRW